jgi:hypothetical protein
MADTFFRRLVDSGAMLSRLLPEPARTRGREMREASAADIQGMDSRVVIENPAATSPTTSPDNSVMSKSLPRFSWLFAVLIAVISVSLRVWHIDALGINSDEAVYAGQAAALAGDKDLIPYFPVFRAHPLLFQSMLSLPYHWGVSTLVGRLMSAAFGLATLRPSLPPRCPTSSS